MPCNAPLNIPCYDCYNQCREEAQCDSKCYTCNCCYLKKRHNDDHNRPEHRLVRLQQEIYFWFSHSSDSSGLRGFISTYLNPKYLYQHPDLDIEEPEYFNTFISGMWYIHFDTMRRCVGKGESTKFLLRDRRILQAINTIFALTTNEEVVRCYNSKLTLKQFSRLTNNILSYT